MRFAIALALAIIVPAMQAPAKSITLASTTSTQNSGLYDYILPIFTKRTGISVKVIAVGTGQALRIAQNGDADAVIVHHRPSEDAFVATGHGIDRRDVMFNDFVIIGPRSDPVGITRASSVKEAFQILSEGRSPFVSRGDDSGTNKRELELWKLASRAPAGAWYREIGGGMGAALNMASVVNAYTLSDRGTWLSFGNKGSLRILFSAEPPLFNPYGLILVNPERHAHVNYEDARQFADWITSPEGQKEIAEFRVSGMRLFCPNSDAYRKLPADQQIPCPG